MKQYNIFGWQKCYDCGVATASLIQIARDLPIRVNCGLFLQAIVLQIAGVELNWKQIWKLGDQNG